MYVYSRCEETRGRKALKTAHLVYLCHENIIFVTNGKMDLLNKTPDPQEYKTHQKRYKN
jgi:hypothetical protein